MNAFLKLSQELGGVQRQPVAGPMPNHAELDVYAGHERRTPADAYRWDGMGRGTTDSGTSVLLQYTLDGHGVYREAGRTLKVLQGQAFVAVIPSRHVYALPDDAVSWTFSGS